MTTMVKALVTAAVCICLSAPCAEGFASATICPSLGFVAAASRATTKPVGITMGLLPNGSIRRVSSRWGRRTEAVRRHLGGGAALQSPGDLRKVPTMKGVLLLALTILFEVGGATCLKFSKNFTNPIASLMLFVCYGISFSLFSLALLEWPLSIAYAIWSGVGTAATAVIGVWVFSETLRLNHWIGIVTIVTGVIAMNM